MEVLIIYCHPSDNSFTARVKDEFIKGLVAAGHQYTLVDLYQKNFNETFSEQEYTREAFYNDEMSISEDVKAYHKLINEADILTFIYPVFWTEAPAKLVGWFQRVWTYGFAYGNHAAMKQLDKALFLVTMGGDLNELVRQEQLEAMKTVMLEDRINERAKEKEMIVFDRMSRDYPNREANFERFLKMTYQIGNNL